MLKNHSQLWLMVIFLAIGLVVFGWVPTAEAQLQDHDPCGNGGPEEPQLTCGKFCGVDFETQELECKDAPISDPGWKTCKIEIDPEDGKKVCSVGEERASCQIA